MPNFLDQLPEVFVSHTEISSRVSQLVSAGKLKKVGSRLYTKNLIDEPEEIIRRHWQYLLKEYYPDAMIADRTALENTPARDGSVFIISSKKRNTVIPGMIFNTRKGPGPIEGDRKFIHDLWICSEPRAFLQNMRSSRARSGEVGRTLSHEEITNKLEDLVRVKGIKSVNHILERAEGVASQLNMDEEFIALKELVSQVQRTHINKKEKKFNLTTGEAESYDAGRVELFLKLFRQLKEKAPVAVDSVIFGREERKYVSFFETYYSNLLDGNRFSVDTAAEIIFQNKIPEKRSHDAYELTGTYQVVSNESQMARSFDNFEGFIDQLKYYHSIIMASRRDKMPGQFRSGFDTFGKADLLSPELVVGTLRKGFEILRGLEYPFQRAVFMLILIKEVKPFAYGNGRIARIFMNKEFITAKKEIIIIPDQYEEQYRISIDVLNNQHHALPLIRILELLQKYPGTLDWKDFNHVKEQLQAKT